ncbi:MAG TPA: DUF4190 domain-containing protein [Planctomycetota bacterium]|nr:DUF4190 domain-containing protein [Planctomycetota bacterium]
MDDRSDSTGQLPEATCPFCCEPIHPAARKCPHCQEYLDPALAAQVRLAPRTSPLAIVSFVLALVSPLFMCLPGPAAMVIGIAALRDRTATAGRRLAVTGIILGSLYTLLLLLVAAVFVLALSKLMLAAPASGSAAEPLF